MVATHSGRSARGLDVLIFMHPQSTPDLAPRLKGNGWLANTIGNPLDTTIALSHLIFEGTLDRFPGLKSARPTGVAFCPRTRCAPTIVCVSHLTWIPG